MRNNRTNRRRFLRNTGAIAAGTVIAGCADDSGSTSSSDEGQERDTESTDEGQERDTESNDNSDNIEIDEDDFDDSEVTDNQPEIDHLHGISGQTYPPDIEGETHRRFEWNALGGEWWYELNISNAVIEYYENRYGRSRNYDMYVFDPYGSEYISNIADEFERLGEEYDLSQREIVNLAVSFVQSMNYTADDVSSPFDQYTYYPVETLAERGGDCEDSTILLAAILIEFGYECVLLYMPDVEPEAHMALGVKGDSSVTGTYYTQDGTRYYYVETTGENWGVGEMPDWGGSTDAEIIEVANHPTLVYEYETVATNDGSIDLNTTVWNYGVESPSQTSFYAEFEDRSGEFYSGVEDNLGTIEYESQVSRQLQMDPPDDIELRLNTYIGINDDLHDIDRSEWRTSPNN